MWGSWHETVPAREVRERRFPAAELRDAFSEVLADRPGDTGLFVEVALVAGLNDQPAHAEALVEPGEDGAGNIDGLINDDPDAAEDDTPAADDADRTLIEDNCTDPPPIRTDRVTRPAHMNGLTQSCRLHTLHEN